MIQINLVYLNVDKFLKLLIEITSQRRVILINKKKGKYSLKVKRLFVAQQFFVQFKVYTKIRVLELVDRINLKFIDYIVSVQIVFRINIFIIKSLPFDYLIFPIYIFFIIYYYLNFIQDFNFKIILKLNFISQLSIFRFFIQNLQILV